RRTDFDIWLAEHAFGLNAEGSVPMDHRQLRRVNLGGGAHVDWASEFFVVFSAFVFDGFHGADLDPSEFDGGTRLQPCCGIIVDVNARALSGKAHSADDYDKKCEHRYR